MSRSPARRHQLNADLLELYVLALHLRGWQRVAVTALLIIPLVLVIIPVMLILLVSVFLGAERRKFVLQLVALIARWARAIIGAPSPP